MPGFWKSLFYRLRPGKKSPFRPLEKKIGYTFGNIAFLEQALSHRSYAFAVSQSRLPSNERMEFLGDAFLGFVVSDFLYRRYARKGEGELSRIKSLIISRKALKTAADGLLLHQHLLLSNSEEKTGGRHRFSINTNAFEALVAAVYLDGGFDQARRFVERHALRLLPRLLKDEDFHNYKSRLLEQVQARGNESPQYGVVEETGPDHNKTFRVSVSFGGRVYGEGQGKNKKDAEQLAARAAIERLEKKLIDLKGSK